ncbi:hypothetical protein L9F63_001405, partial [Diploptera punctata]
MDRTMWLSFIWRRKGWEYLANGVRKKKISLYRERFSMHKAKVVVVGAGAAGVAATARLMENGVEDIVVLEAEDRLGGRVHTILFGDSVLDLGAQWVHGEVGNVVYAMAKEHDLITTSQTQMADTVYIESNGKIANEEASERIINILSIIHKAGDTLLKDFNGSLGDYYTKVFTVKMKEEFGGEHAALGRYLFDWFQKFENSINGADSWFETSGRGLTEYWDCEGNLLLSWKSGGYRKVLDLLMNKYPGEKDEIKVPEKVLYNKEVTHIKWKNTGGHDVNKTVVECSDGSSYLADHVILTASLGVLKHNAHSMFSPALPQKKLNAIKGLSIGTVDKIFMKFPYRWWPEKIFRIWFVMKVNGRHWLQDVFGFYYVDNHPLVLCGWVVGPPARYMEQLSDQQVLEGCYQILQRFAGRAFNVTVPRPERIVRSRWSSNPHFLGSYSYRSIESEKLGAYASHLAEPVMDARGKPVLMFGGEATHDHYYSTVHGAVETGWREADRILRYYGQWKERRTALQDDRTTV